MVINISEKPTASIFKVLEDKGNRFLWYFDNLLLDYMVSHPRKPEYGIFSQSKNCEARKTAIAR
jgi:hypothetical protein